jgi:hypothetical protein
VTVHYRFHPRHGEQMLVIRQHSYRGEAAYIVEQRDGTLTHLPIWMADPESAKLDIVPQPHPSLEALLELRRIIDGAVSSPSSDAQSGGDGARKETAAVEPSGERFKHEDPKGDRGEGAGVVGADADPDHTGHRRGKGR